MFKKMKHMKNEKGLTLIELLAVIVILAIVAAIAIPAIGNIIDNSRQKGAKADIANVMSAANIYFAETTGTSTFELSKSAAGVITGSGSGYVSNLGSIDEISITKPSSGPLTVKATGKVGSKTYVVGTTNVYASTVQVTLDSIKVDSPDVASDSFHILP